MNLSEKIIVLLEPLTGKMMAQSTLTMYCSRIGIKPENLRKENLAELSVKIEQGITIFVGTEKAGEIGKRIRSLE